MEPRTVADDVGQCGWAAERWGAAHLASSSWHRLPGTRALSFRDPTIGSSVRHAVVRLCGAVSYPNAPHRPKAKASAHGFGSGALFSWVGPRPDLGTTGGVTTSRPHHPRAGVRQPGAWHRVWVSRR